MRTSLLPLLLLPLLMACDDAKPVAEPSSIPTAVATATNGRPLTPDSPATAGWDSTKSCDLLPRSAVEAVMGDRVTAAKLGRVVTGNSATPAFSQCNYALASGGSVTFYARQSPGPDNDAAAIAKARASSAAASPGGVVELAGLGKAAWWAEGLRQLHVVLSDDRYVYVTIPERPDAQERARALIARVPG